MPKPPFKQGALTPTTRKPRDNRPSPIKDTMARSQPDAPARKKAEPMKSSPVTSYRTSTKTGKKFGEY